MPRVSHYLRAIAGRLNARRFGASGTIPSGSIVRGGDRVQFGTGFYASGPIWIEAVTEYAGAEHTPRITLGNNVRTSPRLHISAIVDVTVGDWCLFGENVFIADHQHGATTGELQSPPDTPPALRPLAGGRPVLIDERCHLGNNVVVLPGAHIGAGSIIGANAVVAGTIPENSIAAGAPARVIKRWDSTTNSWASVPR